ncbi:hypothetical protein [Sphingomonas sp. LH128]|uniref:hypothetical protein n=1 Tax=Sphingomonas sp. LH128 TaxID=473781 RepID=UPI00155F1278|nr:hypothetical protein [Sphingomonas sp. LH128]
MGEIESLFQEFNRQMKICGYLPTAEQTGDCGLVTAQRQHHTVDEKARMDLDTAKNL